MNNNIDFTDQELREALHRLAERRAPRPLPEDFADRVLARLHANEGQPVSVRQFPLQRNAEAPTAPPPRRLWPWAVAASIAIAIAVGTTLWPRDHGTIYQDTFASAEEACMVLGNGADNNTIIL
ncbi:MAG: hypothetical protein IJ064_04865 [Bacteroidaceae bacterium]|nr:hypothetical protein [Bacteroidaceae bacterium]